MILHVTRYFSSSIKEYSKNHYYLTQFVQWCLKSENPKVFFQWMELADAHNSKINDLYSNLNSKEKLQNFLYKKKTYVVCSFFILCNFHFYLMNALWTMSSLVLTSLESLGRDETLKSLESLMRLFQKVSKIII